MNNIPTAEKFLECQSLKIPHNLDRDGIAYPSTYVVEKMIEFAKLHVKAALEAAAKKDLIVGEWGGEKVRLDDINAMDQDSNWMLLKIDKVSILNAYPENLIK